ncbi:MAG: helix-turn-helix domain-containing protein [Deltaproteobacteria bacterium]|nr:helix-turn-helix domain-containing protein [Deltaproteobacteria bacterium]
MTRKAGMLALSTGQAARYCFVTPETILNWIRTGRLCAQRTMGGQYRIRVRDLRSFLKDHGMSTDLLDKDSGIVPFCWEYFQGGSNRRTDPMAGDCDTCPVKSAKARACHELRKILTSSSSLPPGCRGCEYRTRYAEVDDWP